MYAWSWKPKSGRANAPACPVPDARRCNTERIAIRTVSQVGAGSEHIARALLPLAMAAKQKQKQRKNLSSSSMANSIERGPTITRGFGIKTKWNRCESFRNRSKEYISSTTSKALTRRFCSDVTRTIGEFFDEGRTTRSRAFGPVRLDRKV